MGRVLNLDKNLPPHTCINNYWTPLKKYKKIVQKSRTMGQSLVPIESDGHKVAAATPSLLPTAQAEHVQKFWEMERKIMEGLRNIGNLANAVGLTSQVEKLDQLHSIQANADIEPPLIKKVTFDLSPNHVDRNSTAWRNIPQAVRRSTPSNKWIRRKSRKTQDKISRLVEEQEISTAILQSLEEELSSVGRGGDQVNMQLDENVEPGQAGAGQERNATAPVSQFGDTWDFMNMGTEVDPNPEVKLPQPPSWKNCQQNGLEGCLRDLAVKVGGLKLKS